MWERQGAVIAKNLKPPSSNRCKRNGMEVAGHFNESGHCISQGLRHAGENGGRRPGGRVLGMGGRGFYVITKRHLGADSNRPIQIRYN